MIVINSLFKGYVVLPKSIRKKLVDLFYALKLKRSITPNHQKKIYPYSRQHWALKNISINIQPNSILGIIGLNGSGKSTLLRILSGHLTSSSGFISCSPSDIQLVDESSVSLENDLTVKSSILNSITDFKSQERQEILFKLLNYFELADKQEQSIGSLSLGTKARLTFALATLSVKPILLIDEILGAGDPFWLDRCYYWLNNYCLTNKTVLMTSHNTQLLQRFCSDAIWIDKGQIREFGLVADVTAKYEAYANSLSFQGHSLDTKTNSTKSSDETQNANPTEPLDDENIPESSYKVRSNNRLVISHCLIQTPNQSFTVDVDNLNDQPFEIKEIINGFSVKILCNQPGVYWPTALVTLWTSTGWRLATFQNQSLEVSFDLNQVISISFEQLIIPKCSTDLFVSVSLFTSKSMLTSLEEIAREDYWHKCIKLTSSDSYLESSIHNTHNYQSPFSSEQGIENLIHL